MGKKLLSLLLALVMVVMVLPVTALAAATVSVSAESLDLQLSQSQTLSVTIAGGNKDTCTATFDEGVTLMNGSTPVTSGTPFFTVSGNNGKETIVSLTVTAVELGEHTITFTGGAVCKVNVTCDHLNGLTEIEPTDATCTSEGNVGYWQCGTCKVCFEEDNAEGTAKEPADFVTHRHPNVVEEEDNGTCLVKGHNAHLRCTECDACFEIGEVEFAEGSEKTLESFESAFGAHDMSELIRKQDPTCKEPGHKEGYYCSKCEKYFTDAEGTEEITDWELEATRDQHDLGDMIGEVPASCQNNGVEAHYECAECKGWIKADGTTLIEDHSEIEIVADKKDISAHENLVDKTENGIDYRECTDCNTLFVNGEYVEKLPEHQHKANLNAVVEEGKAATCQETGIVKQYECQYCDAVVDGDGKVVTDPVIPMTKHVVGTKHPAVAATCNQKGNELYYECENCDAHLYDNGVVRENWEIDIDPNNHVNVDHFDANAPTCSDPGNLEYWKCKVCDSLLQKGVDGNYVVTSEDVVNLKPDATKHKVSTKHPAVAATCNQKGNELYYECEYCDAHLYDNGVVRENWEIGIDPNNHVNLDHFEAKEPTCKEPGNWDYYKCKDCDAFLKKDKDGNLVASSESAVTRNPDETKHTDLDHFEAKEPTCKEPGNWDYYQCKECGAFLKKDKDGNFVASTESAVTRDPDETKHTDLEHFEAKEPTCTESGNWDYYQCKECGALLKKDKDGNFVASSESAVNRDPDKTKHTDLEHFEAKEPTCSEPGNWDYYKCNDCGMLMKKNAAGEFVESNEASVIRKPDDTKHKLGTEHPQVDPTCTETGTRRYFECEICGEYLYENGVVMHDYELPIDPNNHSWTETVGDAGGVEYQVCEWCGKYRIGGEGGAVVEGIPSMHNLEFHKGTPATCTEDGEIDYWYCIDEDCGAKFADLKATKPLSDEDLVIPAGHVLVQVDNAPGYWVCTRCGKYYLDPYGNNPTGKPSDAKHALVKHAASNPSCKTGDGNEDYWECMDCGEFYKDGSAEKLMAPNSWVVPFRANNASYHNLDKVEATKDHIEYYYCPNCGMYFDGNADGAKVLEPSDLGITANVGAHALKYMPEIPATCTTAGTKAHWVCLASHNCGKYFADSEGKTALTKADLEIPAGHKYIHFKGTAADMDNEGRKGYDYCTVCGLVRLDGSENWITMDEAMQNWGIEVLPDTAEAVMHTKVPATCIKTGMKKHWSVESLRDHTVLYYLDQALTKPVSEADLVIPMVDHVLYPVAETATSNAYYKCINCGQCFETNDSTKPNIPGGNEDDFIKPTEPPAPTETTPDNVIKDDMDLSGMHMSSILGKGNEP